MVNNAIGSLAWGGIVTSGLMREKAEDTSAVKSSRWKLSRHINRREELQKHCDEAV